MPVDFSIRKFFTPARIWRLRRFFERTQYREPARLRAWRDRRLAEVVRVAYERVPYWRDLFDAHSLKPNDIRTVADLERVPTLSRDAVRSQRARLLAPGRWTQTVRSSGTSGKPIAIHMDRSANALEFVYYWRHFSWAGYRLGDRIAQFEVYHFVQRPKPLTQACVLQRVTNRLCLNSLALSHERIGELAEGLRRYRPTLIKGRPREVYLLALLLREHGLDDIRLNGAFTAAENCLPQYRRTIEAVFGCKVFDSYGHMERAVAISQCEAGGYHVNADYGVMELVDLEPRGPEGEVMGRVLGTTLHNFAMPLLRYEVGDLIEPYPGPEPPRCPCGRALPLVTMPHGRQEDVVITPEGHVVSFIYNVFAHVVVVEFGQIIQDARDHLRVLIVPGEQWGAAQDEELKVLLRRFLGPAMRFDVRHVGRDDLVLSPSGKFRTVISGHQLLSADETAPASTDHATPPDGQP